MTQEQIEKLAKDLGQKYFPDSQNIWARGNVEAQNVEFACLEMAKYVLSNMWIDVKDELPKPPEGEDILVIARSDDSIYIASYADDGWIVDFEGKSIKCNFIKYWMPIPEFSKE